MRVQKKLRNVISGTENCYVGPLHFSPPTSKAVRNWRSSYAFHHRSPGAASRHSLADDKGPLAPDSQQPSSRTELSRAGSDGVLLAIELAVAYPGAAFRRAASGMWSVVAGPIHDAHSAAHEAGFSPVPHTEVPLLRLASSVL